MTELNFADLQWLFGSTKLDEEKLATARRMRGDYMPEWADEFLQSFSADDPTINKETGIKHTVNSMVEDLKQRVQLDAIKKSASFQPPLFVKAFEENWQEEVRDYVERHCLKPSHGQMLLPAIYEAVKDQFGVELVSDAGGAESLLEFLAKLKKEHETPNPADSLPRFDGTPVQMGKDVEQKDRSDFLSQPTK